MGVDARAVEKTTGSVMKNNAYIIFLTIALAFVFCTQQEPVYEENDAKVPDQEFWNAQAMATKNGRLEAIVKYGHMVRYNGDDIAYLDEGVTVDFYNAKGEHSSTLTSLKGEFNDKNNNVKAIGNVVVVSDTGVTLYTEELSFDNKTEKIVSNVDVMVTRAEGDTLYGTSFISNTEFSEWTITSTSGTGHTGVDLSEDRFKKKPKPDSVKSAEPDSLIVLQVDSLKAKDKDGN
jgi:LPS export ABC transporter protein LptC